MDRYAALLWILCIAAPLQADWYRSNAIGRALSPLADPVPAEEEYLLERTRSGEGVFDTLYYFGTEIRRTELLPLPGGERKEIIHEGVERRESLYSGDLPITEDIYQDDRLERSYRYSWDGERLATSELYRGGERVFRQEYLRDSAGRLRTLIRVPSDGPPKVLHFSYREGRLRESWIGGYDDGRLTRFDGSEAEAEIALSGTTEIARIEREEWGEGSLERNIDQQGMLVSEAYFSSRGELLREITYLEGERMSEREYRYEEGRLVESVIRAPARLERRLYLYDEEERLLREELFVNRRLVRRTSYKDEMRIEEFFRREELILRREYAGDELIGEERFDEP